jgi:hypothetical protein
MVVLLVVVPIVVSSAGYTFFFGWQVIYFVWLGGSTEAVFGKLQKGLKKCDK